MTLNHVQGYSLLQAFKYDFCPRNAIFARYLLSSRVRLSVCLSQAGVVPKRLQVGSRRQRCRVAKGLCNFLMQKISTIIYEIAIVSPPSWARDAGA